MNRIHKITGGITVIAILLIALHSCKEIGPDIDLTNGRHNTLLDTTYVETTPQTPEAKNVLIEMFTGIQCINCPDAHHILDNLIATNGGRVIGVAMHSTKEPISQDDSLPDTKQVLGTADAQTIVDAFGDQNFRPTGSVDRVPHTIFGATSIYDDRFNWGGYTTTQLAQTTPVNLSLSRTYVEATHTLTIDVELHYTAAQSDSDKLSIFLTEDSIVTSQLQSNNSDDTSYVHEGVLRKAVTDPKGDKINATLVTGTVVRRIYTFSEFRAIWRPEHMNIIAFVHRYQNNETAILQAKTIKLK